jgi:hypothetical protein
MQPFTGLTFMQKEAQRIARLQDHRSNKLKSD